MEDRFGDALLGRVFRESLCWRSAGAILAEYLHGWIMVAKYLALVLRVV